MKGTQLLRNGGEIALLLTMGTLAFGCAPMMAEPEAPKPALVSPGPSLAISPAVVEYRRKVPVLVAGSGFKPKQEVGLRIEMGGVMSDISYLVRPPSVANEYGAFSSVWNIDDEVRTKLLLPTTYTLTAVDPDGRTLASAPLVFCDPKAKKPAPACAMIAPPQPEKK